MIKKSDDTAIDRTARQRVPSSNCLLISLRRKTCNDVAENTSLGPKAPSLCDVQRNYEAMKDENLILTDGFALHVPLCYALMLQFMDVSDCFTPNKRQHSRPSIERSLLNTTLTKEED